MAEKRRFDLAISQAWHTEAFARAKRLKKLSDYLGSDKPLSRHAEAIAFFHRLKSQGVPVSITRH